MRKTQSAIGQQQQLCCTGLGREKDVHVLEAGILQLQLQLQQCSRDRDKCEHSRRVLSNASQNSPAPVHRPDSRFHFPFPIEQGRRNVRFQDLKSNRRLQFARLLELPY